GVALAHLAFGGSQSAGQTNSGVSAKIENLLGTFDIIVDIQAFIDAKRNGGDWKAAFERGKLSVQVGGIEVQIPNVLKIGASDILFNWDPNYDPTKNGNAPQQILVVQSALLTVPRFGVTGTIAPADGKPGLVVYDNGFDIGDASLMYKPGSAAGSTLNSTGAPGKKIGFKGLIEFDDLRLGVTNFKVRFGAQADFDGLIYFASSGATFLPGKKVSAKITDRVAEPEISAGVPNTEALRLGIEFENGKVKGFVFRADTLQINLGPLTLSATDLDLNTSASDSEEIVSFRSVEASVSLGSFALSGKATNFAFLGDGSFVTKAGFGVYIAIGGSGGGDFKWPSWLPIKIKSIGLEWADIKENPSDFVLILSASVTGIKGIPNLTFSGGIEGIRIDIGKLKKGQFPIVGIDTLNVGLEGKIFGGEVSAALIGGIIRLDASGNAIDELDKTTPVSDRVFFAGVKGSFALAGIKGFSIQFALSELGPLGVFIQAALPTGIMIEPNTGLSINNFSAGVEFFKTLPSIDKPEELRGPDFALPTAQSPEDWLQDVKKQVVKQYQMIKADPSRSGFTAAFTSPMLITGGAKIFTVYASQQAFNGEVIIRISTDGKFLVIGKLNFAADKISISGRLYADISKIASGEATVLFLADIPDQVRLLTIDGRFKMGFRNPNTGEDAEFTVVDPQTGKPYAKLNGPKEDGEIGSAAFINRGYIIVEIPSGPNGATLNESSIVDLSPEFKIGLGSGLELDNSQPPVKVENKYWYWVKGSSTATTLNIIWLKDTWAYTGSDGKEVYRDGGAYQDENGVWQGESANTVAVDLMIMPYLDLMLVASRNSQIDQSTFTSFVASGIGLIRNNDQKQLSLQSETSKTKSFVSLGSGKVRIFFDPTDSDGYKPGRYTLTIAKTVAWKDSSGAASDLNQSFEFRIVDPTIEVSGPFTSKNPSVDVHTANAGISKAYVDVKYKATSGASLDYASIMDSGKEFDTPAGSQLTFSSGRPIPLMTTINADGLAVHSELLNVSGNTTWTTTDWNGDGTLDAKDR
ncbi:MAG: hypothetical protein ACKOAU_11770, partial [Pirellula sp.]